MAGSKDLSPEDRRFLRSAAKAINSNPFLEDDGENRSRISLHNAGETLAPGLKRTIDHLEREGMTRIQHFGEKDVRLAAFAFAYLVFLRFMPDLDELIQQQSRQPDRRVKAPFADPLLEKLRARGFSEHASLRYLALFFQLRRAYTFISDSLVGDSPSMRQLRIHMWSTIVTQDVALYDQHLWNRMADFSTLIVGETGTEKETIAAIIARSGFVPFDNDVNAFAGNFAATLVIANLMHFSEHQIESVLFGHRRGAIAGVPEDHDGLLNQCGPHDVVFLNEIANLPVCVQAKLLTLLQDRVFYPMGSNEPVHFQGRIIAASSHSISELRQKGWLGDGLYYRLCSDIIKVPPLRQRLAEHPEELALLVGDGVKLITGKESVSLSKRILDSLQESLPRDYVWPGNIRELEQAARRILLGQQYEGEVSSRGAYSEDDLVNGFAEGSLTAKDLLGLYCARLYQKLGSYEEVARKIDLDRRTVKKYIDGVEEDGA